MHHHIFHCTDSINYPSTDIQLILFLNTCENCKQFVLWDKYEVSSSIPPFANLEAPFPWWVCRRAGSRRSSDTSQWLRKRRYCNQRSQRFSDLYNLTLFPPVMKSIQLFVCAVVEIPFLSFQSNRVCSFIKGLQCCLRSERSCCERGEQPINLLVRASHHFRAAWCNS